jgi:hypothetical protein
METLWPIRRLLFVVEVIVVGFASRFFLGRGAALHLIRSQQASERTHFMRVVARCRVLQTTVFTRQTKVLGCCCCCCGLGPQWALDGPKLGPLMGPSLGPQWAHDGPIWGLVGHMGPYGLTWAALAHMSPFGLIYAHDP